MPSERQIKEGLRHSARVGAVAAVLVGIAFGLLLVSLKKASVAPMPGAIITVVTLLIITVVCLVVGIRTDPNWKRRHQHGEADTGSESR
jgi:uncharacterized protein YacL